MTTTTHQVALDARPDLRRYGDNAHLLFALELKFQIDDIHTVAANALTDGNDDKKCDLIYVDTDNGYIVVAQGYASRDPNRPAAPAQKATDLNTAAAWLLGRPIEELPERLRSAAKEVRDALVLQREVCHDVAATGWCLGGRPG